MILMFSHNPEKLSALFAVILLTCKYSFAGVEIPPCPEGTERVFFPSSKRPLWASCKDTRGLYQGLLIQFSGQSEMIRIASVKDSLRDGREIRFGEPGTLEERNFKEGHLDGPGYVFLSDVPVGRHFPQSATIADWAKFSERSDESILRAWMKREPRSRVDFKTGRLSEVRFGTTIYRFKTEPEGRIHALNHPEMRGGFFIDPEAIWELNGSDLKAAITPGFGSCKKYSGPIGRFGRDYDALLFKKMPSERKHLDRLAEIRERFIDFCVPKDLIENLGKMECPPQLPSTFPPKFCLVSISDRIHIPYNPKYFKFEFSLGHSPEEISLSLRKGGIDQFLSSMDEIEKALNLADGSSIRLKKTPEGLKFILLGKNESGRTKSQNNGGSKEPWWEWHRIPGL
jgi:hypothetical protein